MSSNEHFYLRVFGCWTKRLQEACLTPWYAWIEEEPWRPGVQWVQKMLLVMWCDPQFPQCKVMRDGSDSVVWLVASVSPHLLSVHSLPRLPATAWLQPLARPECAGLVCHQAMSVPGSPLEAGLTPMLRPSSVVPVPWVVTHSCHTTPSSVKSDHGAMSVSCDGGVTMYSDRVTKVTSARRVLMMADGSG